MNLHPLLRPIHNTLLLNMRMCMHAELLGAVPDAEEPPQRQHRHQSSIAWPSTKQLQLQLLPGECVGTYVTGKHPCPSVILNGLHVKSVVIFSM